MRGAVDSRIQTALDAVYIEGEFEIIVPCHRILGSDGSLTGYAGGFVTSA